MSTELFVKVHSIHIIINPQQSKLLKNVKLKVTMATTKLFFHCLEQLWNNKNSSWYLTCKIVNNYVRISRIFRNPALDVAVSTNWHALITGFWFFFFFFFLMWTIFKVFIECVTILHLLCLVFFWPQGMWDLSCPTKDQTCTPCSGRRSRTAREAPWVLILIHIPGVCHEIMNQSPYLPEFQFHHW